MSHTGITYKSTPNGYLSVCNSLFTKVHGHAQNIKSNIPRIPYSNDHIYLIYNKQAFWLSGNPLHFNMGSQTDILLTEHQCSLTWRARQADMPAKYNAMSSRLHVWKAKCDGM